MDLISDTSTTCLNCANPTGAGAAASKYLNCTSTNPDLDLVDHSHSHSSRRHNLRSRKRPFSVSESPDTSQAPEGAKLMVTIPDALQYLFKLDLSGAGAAGTNLDSLALCGACADIMTKLFVLHKEFDRLTSDISFLGSMLGKVNQESESATKCPKQIPNPFRLPKQLKVQLFRIKGDQVNVTEVSPESATSTAIKAEQEDCVGVDFEDGDVQVPVKIEADSDPEYTCEESNDNDKHSDTSADSDDSMDPTTVRMSAKSDVFFGKETLAEHQNLKHCPNPKEGIQPTSAKKTWNPKTEHCPDCNLRIGGNSSLGSTFLGQQIPIACDTHKHKEPQSFCGICGRFSKSSTEIELHWWSHLGHEEKKAVHKPFLCQHCGKCFPFNGQLTIHVRQRHGPYAVKDAQRIRKWKPKSAGRAHVRYKCPKCEDMFTDECNMKVHLKLHDQYEGRSFSCTGCSHIFDLPKHLARHKLSCDGLAKVRPHQCHICDNRFAIKKQLTRHHAAVHLGQIRKQKKYVPVANPSKRRGRWRVRPGDPEPQEQERDSYSCE